MNRGSDILAYTVTHHDRGEFFERTLRSMRSKAGCWFDWAVYAGNPSDPLRKRLEAALNDPEHKGIQYLEIWPLNRGQHYATREALDLARLMGYRWLLRIDDDVQAKTHRWLKKLLSRVREIKDAAGDTQDRIVAAPRIVGLRHPPPAHSLLSLPGYDANAEVMGVLGGACRLHPVEFLKDYEPDLYAPIGRGDPESIANYVLETVPGSHQGENGEPEMTNRGIMIRVRDIRVSHRTDEIESEDTDEAKHARKMSYVWPFLESEDV
jgi:hypothetical protein